MIHFVLKEECTINGNLLFKVNLFPTEDNIGDECNTQTEWIPKFEDDILMTGI